MADRQETLWLKYTVVKEINRIYEPRSKVTVDSFDFTTVVEFSGTL